jgi:hypothetical protein
MEKSTSLISQKYQEIHHNLTFFISKEKSLTKLSISEIFVKMFSQMDCKINIFIKSFI